MCVSNEINVSEFRSFADFKRATALGLKVDSKISMSGSLAILFANC